MQQAAELFKIPKTVLWRRVQKEMGSYAMSCRARMKQSYGLDKKQAAVKALERGENLTKVSHQFQVLRAQYLNRIIILLVFFGGGGSRRSPFIGLKSPIPGSTPGNRLP